MGEYNIGGDGFEIDRILNKCGITNIATFSGNSSYDQFASAHTADLNAVMCHRSINYVADMLETKYGIPWVKVNFIGANGRGQIPAQDRPVLRRQKLIDRVEEVIAEEMPAVQVAWPRRSAPGPRARRPCCSWAAPGPITTRSFSRNWA